MNKKGDISITLVFVGALILFTLSYYTIFTISNSAKVDSLQIMGKNADFIEGQIRNEANIILVDAIDCLEKGLNKNCIQESARNREFYISGTDFFAKVRQGEFELEKEGELISFSVNNVVVETSYKNNKLERRVDINVNTNRQQSL